MTSCLHAPIGKKQLDGYPNLSDGLKGRLKNTASEKPCRPTADRRNRTSRRMPHLSGRFRNSNPPIRPNFRTYNRNITLPPSVPTQNTAAVAAGFPAKAAMGQNLYSNRSTIHHPGVRNTIGRSFRRPPRYKQIKNRSFAGSAIDGTMSAIPKTIIPPP